MTTGALKLARLAESFLAKLWFLPALRRRKEPSDNLVKRLEAPEWVCDLKREKTRERIEGKVGDIMMSDVGP